MDFSDHPWRVIADYGELVELRHADGSVTAVRPNLSGPRPVTGDWVSIDRGRQRILAAAPRRSWLARAGRNGRPQFVAANLTAAFVVTSPEPREFSPRRVTRYLVALAAGKVEAVVLLNKCDCVADAGDLVAALRAVSCGTTVVPISARDGTSCELLAAYLHDGATVALCGSSGVGKSTLLNRLAETAVVKTAPMRADGRGRHTTTVRRLVTLPSGASLIDTPGMRAFEPWAGEDDVGRAFDALRGAAGRCRFTDCRHAGEPGCAVREAVTGERLEQWRKLQREAAWRATLDDPLLAIERKRAWKRIHKQARRERG
ncbi:MAG TPA: ribosome small subunit-dependent GTPase A [Candidatus Acidoferrales bacterium]|nr:ribosome small subunit-dependent GTPase A [Candidatus Acidoferrales bacterium]